MDAMEGECETKWPTWMKGEMKGTQMDVKQNGGQAHEPTTNNTDPNSLNPQATEPKQTGLGDQVSIKYCNKL